MPDWSVRVRDVALASIGLVILFPVAVVVTAVISLADGGPPLHWSRRIGRNGQEFLMPKFRTMRVGTPSMATDKLPDPSRHLSPVGGVLRRFSIDEIPQLWSVLTGDMSLVGPRPALYNQQELIAARRAAGVDRLRPGVTGWAQVNGRDAIPESRKVELDVYYLREHCWQLDAWILAATVWRVVRAAGVSH